jgi:hypothetical protein
MIMLTITATICRRLLVPEYNGLLAPQAMDQAMDGSRFK